MSAYLPVTSLPAVLQTFLKSKRFAKKTVSVRSDSNGLVRTLRERRVYHSEYDDFDPGDAMYALSLKDGRWMPQPTAGSGDLHLREADGPWALVTFWGRSGAGASIEVDAEGAKLFGSSESLTLPPEAAQLLYCFVKRSTGKYRAQCARAVPGGRDGPFADWLTEHGLVKRNAGGSYVVTDLGKQVAAKLPDVYDPELYHGVYRTVWPQHLPYLTEDRQLKPYTSGGSLLGFGEASSWMRTPGGR